jgi:hypothetical protein
LTIGVGIGADGTAIFSTGAVVGTATDISDGATTGFEIGVDDATAVSTGATAGAATGADGIATG